MGLHAAKDGERRRERGTSKGIYLGLDVADGVVFGNVEHQVLDALRKAHHQLAWWDRTTRIEYILWDGICTLLAFGFLAEGLHVLQVIKTRFPSLTLTRQDMLRNTVYRAFLPQCLSQMNFSAVSAFSQKRHRGSCAATINTSNGRERWSLYRTDGRAPKGVVHETLAPTHFYV